MRTFASLTTYASLQENGETTLSPSGYYEVFDAHGESGINEERVAEICKETGSDRTTVIEFIKNLYNIQQNNKE